MDAQERARAGASGAGPDQKYDVDERRGHCTYERGAGDASTTLTAALRYARAGLAVFPLRPAMKVPYAGSGGHRDATTDPGHLRATWPAPDANVGVATGTASGVWVLDVDPRHNGDEGLRALLQRHRRTGWGTPPVTETPRGGEHYWFRCPPDRGVPCSVGRVGPGLDVRGDGGYVVVPPSRVPKGAYRWRRPRGKLGGAPGWLLDLTGPRGEEHRFAEPVAGTVPDGMRNVALTSLAGSMRDRGCEADELYALLKAANARRCKPPLPDREVRAVVQSVMRYAPGDSWWAVDEAEDAAAEEWLEAAHDEAASRWLGGAR